MFISGGIEINNVVCIKKKNKLNIEREKTK